MHPSRWYAEAEPLLLDAAEHCDRSEATRWWHWCSVLEESVWLYDAWHADEPDEGHDVEAAEWRAMLATAGTSETQGGP